MFFRYVMPLRSWFFLSLLLALVLSAEIRVEVVNDFSRLNPITVAGVIQVKSVEDIVDGIHKARSRGLSLSIAAKRNSQGDHIAKPGNLVLDMNRLNQVLALDV